MSKVYYVIKKVLAFVSNRIFIVAMLVLLQIAIMFAVPDIIASIFPDIYNKIVLAFNTIMAVLGAVAVVFIVSKDENPYFKISWISLFFFLPVVGLIIYLIMANRETPMKIQDHMYSNLQNVRYSIPPEAITSPEDKANIEQGKYVRATSAYPVLANTDIDYFELGDTMFPAFIEDLKKAKKYIFMEFFIVAGGVLMDELLMVLRERIENGVEVYFMYDDVGSITTAPSDYTEKLLEMGINARVFNPLRPRINPVLNYRDHRKIIVVDGNIAYCGGMNLADEYINKKERFGHWKDTGVRLEGDAAWPFALMFMQQWRLVTGEALNTAQYSNDAIKLDVSHGFVQVYGDDPLAKYNIAENVYLNAIWQAKEYIYITTPYLIIDNAMESALCYAAISGVDVRIITPKIYDKWYVHIVTRSNYKKLIKNGVKIYEYTPGFLHSKMFVCDDKSAMVGTSNMDFRSFYHHFECSVLIYEHASLSDIKKDILNCIEVSEEMTFEEMDNQPIHIRIVQSILKLFTPML